MLNVHKVRVDRLLDAAGLEEMLVFGNARVLGTGTQAFPTFHRLLGFDTGNAIAIARLRRATAPAVISPSYFLIDDLNVSRQDEVQFIYAPWSAIGRTIADVTSGDGKIGLLGRQEMPVRLWSAITQALDPSRFVDVDGLANLDSLAPDAVQTADHLAAAKIVDALFARLPTLTGQGEPTWKLQRRLEAEAMLQGADQCVCWMTVAPHADYCHAAKTACLRIPQADDQLLLGVMLTLNGAWGHGIRTYHCGAPPPALIDLQQQIMDIQRDVLGLLTPGEPLSQVNDRVEALYRQQFPADLDRARRFRTVHGLGFSYEEPASSPMFRQPFDEPIKGSQTGVSVTPGMIFELHPNLFLPEIGGVAIGDMVLVGAEGNQRLTNFPQTIHEI